MDQYLSNFQKLWRFESLVVFVSRNFSFYFFFIFNLKAVKLIIFNT